MPVIPVGRTLRVGAMPSPGKSGLETTPDHGAVAVRYGRVRDGVGASLVIRYLSENTNLIQRFVRAPVVRYVEGVTATHKDEIVQAVQFLNGNLPRDFQITIGSVVSAAEDARLDRVSKMKRGEILVKYARRENWGGSPDPNWVGAVLEGISGSERVNARIWVDQTRIADRTARMSTLMHELLHALGRNHPDPGRSPDTVMNNVRPLRDRLTRIDLMYPVDREALLAVYDRLDAGDPISDIANRLGPWEDASIQVYGELGETAFGAALRNGLVRPWAHGPNPGLSLANNTQLAGSVSWTGRLLGLTPGGQAVAGAAGLTVDLASLRGDLDFTGMEQWTGNPGAPGSGTRWGDGDLNYDIAVKGNTFSRLAGIDEGIVTGAFFGNAHQGMGGTLVREDFSAGFAGKR